MRVRQTSSYESPTVVRISEFDLRIRAFGARERIFYDFKRLNLVRLYGIYMRIVDRIYENVGENFGEIKKPFLVEAVSFDAHCIASYYCQDYKRARLNYERTDF